METKEQRIERAKSYLMDLAAADSDPELLNAFHALSFLQEANAQNSGALKDCVSAIQNGEQEAMDLAVWVADTTLKQFETKRASQ